jgi:inosose dehydratase
VETPDEIDALMARTNAGLVGLVLDTGHILYGGGDPVAVLDRYASRIWHVHYKDCDGAVAADARQRGRGYLEAVRAQLFCQLGEGAVDFTAVTAALRRHRYDGWIVVEQDVFPGYGTPAVSAGKSRRYLQTLGL